jgi:O-succinylbenzoic acid--CoA ligase
LLEDCARRGLPAIQTYGLTEAASQVTTLPPAEALRKLGSAGKPLFGTEVRIAPLEEPSPKPSSPRRGWREAPGEGGIGEIIIRGPTLTPGYWRNPEATARAWRDGWWHTGDVGRLDDEGYLYVLDRRDDLIISGGENIYPAEVEAALLAHPAIEEAAVIGQDDAQWGQVPVAFICLRPGQDVRAAELCAFCADRLAKYKIPVQWHGVEALPRNASGKLLRHELKRLALKNRDIIHPLP